MVKCCLYFDLGKTVILPMLTCWSLTDLGELIVEYVFCWSFLVVGYTFSWSTWSSKLDFVEAFALVRCQLRRRFWFCVLVRRTGGCFWRGYGSSCHDGRSGSPFSKAWTITSTADTGGSPSLPCWFQPNRWADGVSSTKLWSFGSAVSSMESGIVGLVQVVAVDFFVWGPTYGGPSLGHHLGLGCGVACQLVACGKSG